MAGETVGKILQTKHAISERAFRTGENSRLSISEAVKSINTAFKTPNERRAVVGDRVVECRNYREVDGVLGLYLVGYVPEDPVGIVPHGDEDLALLPPPKGADFLDGELMALIAEDTIIVCRLGLYESALGGYIKALGPKAGLDPEDAIFMFKNRADIDKLKLIQDDGVASIRFDGVANSLSVEDAAEAHQPPIEKLLSAVWEEIEALTYADAAPRPDSENLKVEVFLKFDKRSGTQIDQDEIQEIAKSITDSEDGFEIVTLNGRKIKPDDVLLNKRVPLKKYGKSVAFNEVFAAMMEYYGELTEAQNAEQ